MANRYYAGMSGVNVTGMTGGTAGTSNAAHTVHGGMGNTVTNYTGGRTVNQSVRGNQGAVSLAGVEARDINIQHRAPEGRPRVGNVKSVMTGVRDLGLILRREKFSEEVIKNFQDNGINGRYLIELTDDNMMEELGVTSALGKMKLRKIIKDFTREIRDIDKFLNTVDCRFQITYSMISLLFGSIETLSCRVNLFPLLDNIKSHIHVTALLLKDILK